MKAVKAVKAKYRYIFSYYGDNPKPLKLYRLHPDHSYDVWIPEIRSWKHYYDTYIMFGDKEKYNHWDKEITEGEAFLELL
jgi:hypothetical protein